MVKSLYFYKIDLLFLLIIIIKMPTETPEFNSDKEDPYIGLSEEEEEQAAIRWLEKQARIDIMYNKLKRLDDEDIKIIKDETICYNNKRTLLDDTTGLRQQHLFKIAELEWELVIEKHQEKLINLADICPPKMVN